MLTRHRAGALLALLVGLLAPAVAFAPPALAHAALTGSDPADGSRLGAAPAQVTLRFSERVSLGVGGVRVVDARGERVDAGPATHRGEDGDAVSVPLRADLGAGGYLVSFRMLSADSHPVTGAVTFAVGDAPLPDPSGAVTGGTGTDGALGAALVVARWGSYAGLVLLGGAVFVLTGWAPGAGDRRVRRLLAAGGAVVAAGAVGTLLLQGPYAAGQGIGSIGSAELLRATLQLPVGKLLLLRLAALLALGWLLGRALAASARGTPRGGAEDAAAVAALVLLFSHAAVGHPVSDPLPTAAVIADIAHLAAMSAWLGGLVLVAGVLLRDRPADEAAALPRFSRMALWCVVTLVLTGSYRALIALGPPGALLGDPYGRLLLLKLAGLAGLVALGAGNRRVLRRLRSPGPAADPVPAGSAGTVLTRTPPVPAPAPDHSALRRLRRSVATEVVLGAAVLAVAAVLVGQPQSRTTYPAEVTATVTVGPAGRAELVLSPARAGGNTVRLRLSGPAPREVELTAALPAEGLGPLRVPLDRLADGSYRSRALTLPRPGGWQLTLRVRTGEFDATVARATVRVR